LPGPARLSLSALWATDKPGYLRIEVRDNGVGLQPNPRSRGTGLGLRNVRERLQAMHSGQATLAIAGLPEGGVSATIDWPLAANPMNKTTTEAPATP
jgi:signal transduction histidine kinase